MITSSFDDPTSLLRSHISQAPPLISLIVLLSDTALPNIRLATKTGAERGAQIARSVTVAVDVALNDRLATKTGWPSPENVSEYSLAVVVA